MVFGFAFVFYYPHPASIFSFPPVISPVAGASFFGALENTRPLFILSPQYRKWNFNLGVEVSLLVIWIINTSTAIFRSWFFFHAGRKIKSQNLLESDLTPPPPHHLLPLNKGWAVSIILNTVWNLRQHTEHVWKQNVQQEMDCPSCSIYVSAALFVRTRTAHGRWEEWLAVGTDLYFPSLLSILWDQLCYGNTSGGLLQCVTAGVGLRAHCRFIVLLDQDLYSHTPLPSKSLLCARTFIYLWHWVLHNAPWVGDRIPHRSDRAGSAFKKICFYRLIDARGEGGGVGELDEKGEGIRSTSC